MVVLSKIYTKTGDAGETALGNGARVAKHSPRVSAYGTVDETNATVGLARQHASGDMDAALARISNDLFDLGADLATPGDDFAPSEMVLRVVQSQVDWLETAIDALNETLPALTSFILPGGSEAAARIHVARATVRRAERAAVELDNVEAVNPLVLAYLNRLSDHLFVMARAINAQGSGDVLWQPGATR